MQNKNMRKCTITFLIIQLFMGCKKEMKDSYIEYPTAVYSLIDTEREKLPAVLVINSALGDYQHKEQFPWHLSITIKFEQLAENGMPTREEDNSAILLEDAIEKELIKNQNAIFFSRETWNGRKKIIYRIQNPKIADRILKSLTQKNNILEWEYKIEKDLEWRFTEIYFDILNRANENA